MTVRSPVHARTAVAALSGLAIPQVSLSPGSLNFPDVTVGSTGLPLTVTVTNNRPTRVTFGSPRVAFTGPAAGDFSLQSTTCLNTLNSGASCNILVAFRPSAGGGRSATLAVNTNALNSPHLAALTGIGTTPLTITPTNVTFGSTNVGLTSAPQQVTIRNNQAVGVTFAPVSVTGDFALDVVGTTCGTTLGAAQSCVISLTMRPTVAGPRTGSLVITSGTTSSPIALSGIGINGVTASATSLTFAPQLVNTTSGPQQVLLTNHQAVPAAIGAIVSGDFAARRRLRGEHRGTEHLRGLDHVYANGGRHANGDSDVQQPGLLADSRVSYG